MNQVVYKYEIPPPDGNSLSLVELPCVRRLLHVAAQGDRLFVWALVDPQARILPVTLKVVGTGHPFDERHFSHLGTAIMSDSALVWHVFQHESNNQEKV